MGGTNRSAKELTQERRSTNEGWALVGKYARLTVCRPLGCEGDSTGLSADAQQE